MEPIQVLLAAMVEIAHLITSLPPVVAVVAVVMKVEKNQKMAVQEEVEESLGVLAMLVVAGEREILEKVITVETQEVSEVQAPVEAEVPDQSEKMVKMVVHQQANAQVAAEEAVFQALYQALPLTMVEAEVGVMKIHVASLQMAVKEAVVMEQYPRAQPQIQPAAKQILVEAEVVAQDFLEILWAVVQEVRE